MRKQIATAFAAPLALVALAGAAEAQTAKVLPSEDIMKLSEWNQTSLYEGGIRAESLLNAEVFGQENGGLSEELGTVENVLLNRDNKIVAIIAQVGGFWDIGDTHVLVPWEQVALTDDGVGIPVNEDNVQDYGLYREESIISTEVTNEVQAVDDDAITASSIWKLTDLIDDYAVLSDQRGYGYVDDAIFDSNAVLQAVIVEPDVGYGADGPYATPFYGYDYGWEPGLDSYNIGYGTDEVAGLDTFDYGAVEGPLD